MFENFSAKAIEALQLAREEARRLEFAQVDTDHLLLGLLAEGNGVAARALRLEGVDLRRARVAAEQLGGRGYMRASQLFFSSDCQAVFFDAAALAAQVEPVLVDTQDLLFALLKHPGCRAIALLRHLDADLEALHRRVRSVRAQDLESPSPPPGPDRPVPPKHFSPRLLTPSARKAYDQAFAMARAAGHTLVGTEQLLVALLAVDEGLASRVLAESGMRRLDAEAVLHRVMGLGSGTVDSKHVLSRRAQEALDAAWREACARSHDALGTGHVLLGLLGLDAGGALTLMDHLRLNLGAVQLDTEQAFDDSPRDPEPRWAGDALLATGDECPLP
ncbi:MAG TPA: Clp protease N-terminal domain-containing protein [Pantanalinema sp.]